MHVRELGLFSSDYRIFCLTHSASRIDRFSSNQMFTKIFCHLLKGVTRQKRVSCFNVDK